MTTKRGHIYRKLSGQFTTAYDILRDYKITGRSLVKYVPSIDKTKSTGSESTRYWSLDTIFKDFDFNQSGKWEKQKENIVFKKGLLAYSYYPLRYTIWKYKI